LTYALVNPQQAGLFAQVGDDQLIALKKLTAIFEGMLPTHKQQTATLLLNNTSKSPQRVDITESHNGHMPAVAPRVVEPTASNKKTPNSHHRLQTTPHRPVTPIPPHHMNRRSAGPLNLSQDVLDETVNKQIRSFISHLCHRTHKLLHNQQKTNKQMIIMPEMANAVTFPDTGKSLKHSELITLLRYKIRWMRSTANERGRLAQGLKRGVKGTNTIKFIRREDVPAGRKAKYGSFVIDIKTHKEQTEYTGLTVVGDKI
jgi:hypothetical protein